MNWPSPGTDPWYAADQTTGMATRNFYSPIVNATPTFKIDGGSASISSASITAAINARRTVPAHIWFSINTVMNATNDSLVATIKVVADSAYTGTNFVLRAMLVEIHEVWTPAAPNGQTSFDFPMISFSPNYNGTAFTHTGNTNDTLTFRRPFALRTTGPEPYTTDNCRIIAYVRNETTKEVHNLGYCHSITNPTSDDPVFVGSQFKIRWNAFFADTMNILLNRNYPTGTWDTLARGIPNSGIFNWTVTGPNTSNARLRIYSTRNAWNADTSETAFAIGSPSAIYGIVTAQTGGAAMDSVTVTAGTQTVRTNAQGRYRLSLLSGQYTVTATKPGWNTYTSTTITLAGNDSVSHNIAMRRPAASVTPTSIEMNIRQGDSLTSNLSLRNSGDGPLNYSAAIITAGTDSWGGHRTIEMPAFDPNEINRTTTDMAPGLGAHGSHAIDELDTAWQVRMTINLDPATGNVYGFGAEYDGRYIITAASTKFYRFNAATGAFVDSLAIGGLTTTGFTIRDMCFDGTYIYGSWDGTIRAFNPTTGAAVATANITTAAGIGGLARALAYDPATDNFFVSNWGTVSSIFRINRAGTVLQTYTNHSGVGGLAWYANDPDGKKLYVYTQATGFNTQIYKLNTTTGDTSMVIRPLPGAATADISAGCFISILNGYTMFGGVVQGSPDRLIVCELGSGAGDRWWITPNAGTVTAGSNATLTVGYKTAPNAPVGSQVSATARITWGATDEIINVPITVTILTDAPPEHTLVPNRFELTGAYPNPFNPTTTIKFVVGTYSNVKLTMYDITGRQISTLLDMNMPAGEHSIGLKANSLPTGTYFVRMEAGSHKSVTKVVLLK